MESNVTPWSPEQWVTLIGGACAALGAMVVAIINAIQNRHLKEQNRVQQAQNVELLSRLKTHEARANLRAAMRGDPPVMPPAEEENCGEATDANV